ncbi:hypothetical protein DEO72_LG8g2003 [Vigna unguiculata]|uniref:Uncharacterized protein n=1 Tax=Vigna unguiculata TaxID=3917 RepID=A0A4D6MTM0_VIGUN|nr:hypothetical protein DEO72_LG8g2003 [Vigna unguiculata]
MQSFSFSPKSHRPPQPQCRYITLDSISGLCKRHWISGWLAPVTVPKHYRVGHKELSPDRSQGKSPSRLRLDQVQRLGPPATPHDIIHYALSERE